MADHRAPDRTPGQEARGALPTRPFDGLRKSVGRDAGGQHDPGPVHNARQFGAGTPDHCLRSVTEERHLRLVDIGTASAQLLRGGQDTLGSVPCAAVAWLAADRLQNADHACGPAPRDEIIHQGDARLWISIRAPDDQQLQRGRTLGHDLRRHNLIVDSGIRHQFARARQKDIRGGDQRAARRDRTFRNGPVPCELAVKQRRRGIGRQRPQRRHLEVRHLPVRHRAVLFLCHHRAQAFALVNRQHGKGAGGACEAANLSLQGGSWQ